jgi:hypothetical protein
MAPPQTPLLNRSGTAPASAKESYSNLIANLHLFFVHILVTPVPNAAFTATVGILSHEVSRSRSRHANLLK